MALHAPPNTSQQIAPSPSQPNIQTTHRRLTYSLCHNLIQPLIAGIQTQPDFTTGTRIALIAFNSWVYPVLTLAIVAAGGIFVGTNPRYTKYGLEHALEISGANYIFSETEEDTLSSISQAMTTGGLLRQDRLLVLDIRPGQRVAT